MATVRARVFVRVRLRVRVSVRFRVSVVVVVVVSVQVRVRVRVRVSYDCPEYLYMGAQFPSPKRGRAPSAIFGPSPLWPNGCMDEGGTGKLALVQTTLC